MRPYAVPSISGRSRRHATAAVARLPAKVGKRPRPGGKQGDMDPDAEHLRPRSGVDAPPRQHDDQEATGEEGGDGPAPTPPR